MTPSSLSKITPKRTQDRAFTLIELLIVITIIAILATMILAGGSFAVKRARITQAQNLCIGVMNACQNFETEYNRMPVPATGGSEDWKGNTDSPLVLLLAGKDTTKNKKEIDFLDGIAAASGTPPTGGIDYTTSEALPVITDPWGNFLIVHIDNNYDGKVTNPEDPAKQLFNTKFAVLAVGEDQTASGVNPEGTDATNDNAKSY